MITDDDKKIMADYFISLGALEATDFPAESESYPEYLTYLALEIFDTIIILEEFSCHTGDLTEYFIYDKYTRVCRKATALEDTWLRCADQESDEPFREQNEEHIISKGSDNKIVRWNDTLDI